MNTKIAASLVTTLFILSACVTPTDVSLAEKPAKVDEATAVESAEANDTNDTAEVPSSTNESEEVVVVSADTTIETTVPANEAEDTSDTVEESSSIAIAETYEETPDVPYAAIYEYSWNHDVARAIIMAESGGNPRAVNNNPRTRDYSIGLFQINLYGRLANERPPADWLKVPENNIQYAYTLYQQRGWQPWSVCKNGAVRCSR